MDCVSIQRDEPRALASGSSLRTDAQSMRYLTCTMILIVDLRVTGYLVLTIWVAGDCGTM